MTRFPFAPLAELIEAQWRPVNESDDLAAGLTGKTSRVLGVNRHIVWKWRRSGLSEYHADMAATRLGLHPCQVWPEQWFEVPAMEWIDGVLWCPTDWLRKCALEESWRLRGLVWQERAA